MSNTVQLITPHLFLNVGIRFIRSDGSTSEIVLGNKIEIKSKGQATSMVIQEQGTVELCFILSRYSLQSYGVGTPEMLSIKITCTPCR